MKKTLKYLFAFLTILFVVMAFSGCGKNNKSVSLMDTAKEIQGLEDYKPSGVMSQTFSENVTYEVSNVTWEGNTGVAEVKVKTPDLEQIISDAIQDAIEAHGIDDYELLRKKVKEKIQAVLESGDYPTIEEDVEMDAIKNDEGYTLVSNEEFENIISGKLKSMFIQALMEGMQNDE